MASSAEDLRDRIDDHFDKLSSLEELDDERYHATHETFEAGSNQRELILEWLAALVSSLSLPTGRSAEMLSVGCGGGVMDRRFAQVVADHADAISLAGVDPNPEHTRAFKQQLSGEGFDVEVFTGGFEDFRSEQQYDIIHFIHCLYYFEHIEPELRKAVDMLSANGALVVLQAPNEALNHLADRVWKKQFDQSAWYSDDVVSALKGMDIDLQVERIDAEVDVTDCFYSNSETGTDMLDFIVQAETRKLSSAFQASLLESLRSICRQQGDRLLCKHPVDAIVARKRNEPA
ncbi:MAG TPA: methyltransferase domain-containing protein [Wenzhouxiangellaceae bacterium]|nr:methyltransferase domain-containing protein [Wenzhouxiangellaceae bacterium]